MSFSAAPIPNQFGDIITAYRTDYVQKNETKQIVNGIVELSEVPDAFTKVQVSGNNMNWYETKDAPSGNLFQVDYGGSPLVYFDPQYNGVSLQFQYMGTGAKLISSNQVYTALDANGNVAQTLSDLTTSASTATTQAQQATTDANNATSQLTTLENTVNTNEQTRQTNEQSRVTAEQNRVTAENNRVTAESDRQNNESTRQSDETSRQNAESSRVAAESSRVSAEQDRVNAEATRQNDESTRQTNETNRVNAESDRATAENARVSQENTRQTNETNRENAESTRESNETTRQNQESSRVSAENTRVSQESDRVTAENTRNSNETTRQSQESTRQTNETSRENAEQTRATNEDTRQSNESTRESNESTRQSNETARQNAINNLASQSATWSNAIAYKARNIVRYGSATYIALQDNTGFEPDLNLGTYWQVVAEDGSVTSVSSANSDISVANGTTAPVLTVNSGNGANQLWKLDANANAILDGNIGVNTSSPTYGLHMLGGGARIQMLTTPSAPTVANVGTSGTASYFYYIVAKDRNGNRSFQSASGSTSTGNATLDTNNYNTISWTAVAGAVSYDVLTIVSGTYYLLGSTSNLTFNDTGIARSTIYTIPTYNETSDLTLDGNVNLMPQKPAKSIISQNKMPSSRLNFVWSNYSSGTVSNKTAYMYVSGDTYYWYDSNGTSIMTLNASGGIGNLKRLSAAWNTLDDGNGNSSFFGDMEIRFNTIGSSPRLSFLVSPDNGATLNEPYLKVDGNATLGYYSATDVQFQDDIGTLVFSVDKYGNVNANAKIASASGHIQGLPTPSGLSVTNTGTAGTTSYSYYVVAKDGDGNRSIVSSVATTTTGNAVLNGTNYNTISWSPVIGAVSYDVLKGNTSTLLGNTTSTTLNDTGQGTSVYTPPTYNESANLKVDGLITQNGVPVQLNQMVTSLPTASTSYRGQTIVLQGDGVTTADVAYICLMSATGTYSWKQVVSG